MTNRSFRPENYPRQYKQAIECSIMSGMLACFSASILAFDVWDYGTHYRTDEKIPLACLLVSAIWYLGWGTARLKLTADTIEVRGRFSLFWDSLRRDEIAGIRSIVDWTQPYFFPFETVFVPKDPSADSISVPMIFRFDDDYDAWVKTLPFLGGVYKGPGPYDRRRQISSDQLRLMDWEDHMWRPRRSSLFR